MTAFNSRDGRSNFWWLLLSLGFLLAGCGFATAAEFDFTILHTSDEHSNLLPAPFADYSPQDAGQTVGGYARLSTLARQIRDQKASEPVLLFSSGDFIGGTAFSWLLLTGEVPEIALMRKLGYAATTFGNHEFDYGPEKLADYLARGNPEANWPTLLSANIAIPEEHPFKRLAIARHMVFSLDNGLKLGVFGLMGKGAHRLAPAARPLDFADQHESARRAIAAMKAEGADVIIALTHAGSGEDKELARAVAGIHLILGGHEHLTTEQPLLAGKTMIMHSGCFLRSAGQLDLSYDRATDVLRLRNQQTGSPIIHKLDSSIAADPEIEKMINGYQNRLNALIASCTAGVYQNMGQVIARSEFALIKEQPLSESTVGNFVTDAIRFEAARATGASVDIAFHANGIIRGNIIPGVSPATRGNITFFDLAALSGLGVGRDNEPGYPLVSFYLTGAEVLNMLEIATLLPLLWGDVYFLQVSGLRYTYDPKRAFWLWLPIINKPLPAYRSVLRAEKFAGDGLQNGQNFVPLAESGDRLYHVATTHYLASYLPMVGQKLPKLNVTLKNKLGQPIELDQTLIKLDGREFKLWEATARYAQSFAAGSDGIAVIPEYYRHSGQRIIVGKGTPLWLAPIIISSLFLLLLAVYRQRSRKPTLPAVPTSSAQESGG